MSVRVFAITLLLPLLAFGADERSKKVILILGPPGSGKTVQARNLSRKLGVPAISMADLLKQNAGWGRAGSQKQLKAQIESGELVNDEMASRIMADRLRRPDTERGFVLDGYPTTSKQAENLDGLLKERSLPAPTVVQLEVPDAVVLERMQVRGRADDQPEIMQRRLEEYHREATYVLKHY